MHLYINQLLFVLAHFRIFILTESARNELIPLVNITNACPGDVLMYRCNIVGSGNTIWTGTAFNNCSNNEIILRHSTIASGMAFGNCNGGAISARGLGVDNNCYSSQLNVTVNSDLNNKTIRCDHSSDTVVTIRTVTLSVATVPPTNVKLVEVSPGELVFNWTASAGSPVGLYYIVNSTCGTCPNMTSATMVTCSNLNLSTITTMCTFSVRSAVCGTTGSPSTQVAVTLGVPDVPNVAVIPQYSLTNDGQLLTNVTIIVCINQTATSFSITDTISGSTASYSIFFSENNIRNVTACLKSTCEYVIDVPPSICSSSTDVDITIAAANRLGQGPPSELVSVGCINEFVKVKYDSSTTTISCTFENQLDSSIKSCSVKYGVCGQEMYNTQGNTTTESPFIVTLKLNLSVSNRVHCFIITANNDTHGILVEGRIDVPANGGANVPAIIIPVILVLLIAIFVTVIGGITVYYFKRRQHEVLIGAPNNDIELTEQSMLDYSQLIQIRSQHFILSKVPNECTVGDFCSNKKLNDNRMIFVKHNPSKSDRSLKIRDAIVMDKSEKFYTGPALPVMIKERQNLTNLFVLPVEYEEKLHKDTLVLHQNPKEMFSKFKVLLVEGKKGSAATYNQIAKFIGDKLNLKKIESERVFYELSLSGPTICLTHYVEVISINVSEKSKTSNKVKLQPNEELMHESGVHFFYTEMNAPGERIKHPGKNYRVFIQCATQELAQRSFEAGSVILYKVDITPDDCRQY